ncbi:MAG TPA: response regulator [Blastocatellia bacterium]|nr:response regulator [Blastocatellia bacterium]
MSRKSASVLIVDDHAPTLELLAACLSPQYDCTMAASAEEAAKLLAANSYDVVLADVWLPGRSGLDLCQLVQARYAHTPVIVMSAVPDLKQEAEAAKRRAFEYLNKPISVSQLMDSIDRALRYQATFQELSAAKHRA